MRPRLLGPSLPQDPAWQMERALVSKLLADGPQPEPVLRAMDIFIPPFFYKFEYESKVGASGYAGLSRARAALLQRPAMDVMYGQSLRALAGSLTAACIPARSTQPSHTTAVGWHAGESHLSVHLAAVAPVCAGRRIRSGGAGARWAGRARGVVCTRCSCLAWHWHPELHRFSVEPSWRMRCLIADMPLVLPLMALLLVPPCIAGAASFLVLKKRLLDHLARCPQQRARFRRALHATDSAPHRRCGTLPCVCVDAQAVGARLTDHPAGMHRLQPEPLAGCFMGAGTCS